jgi:hypothetical protein
LASAAAPEAWGWWPWLVSLLLLVLLGALRRPQRGWLLALEAWLAFVLADRAYAAWGPPPAGLPQPPLDALIESLLVIPLAWALVALGRALSRGARGPSGPAQPGSHSSRATTTAAR